MSNTVMNTNNEQTLESAFARLEQLKTLTQSGQVKLDDMLAISQEAEQLRDMLQSNIQGIQKALQEKKKQPIE